MPPSGSPRDLARRRLRAPRARPGARLLAVSRPAAGGGGLSGISSALTTLTAVCAVILSWMTVRMTTDGQIASRYTNAVEQLGKGNSDTRIGAIYALARLTHDSEFDRPVVIRLLTDYVRSRIGPGAVECRDRGAPAADVVAALRMLFYNIERTSRDDRVDLRDVCLTDVDFPRADLTCVRLDNAVIDRANFAHAILRDTSLQGAQLRGTIFNDADFTRADASRARFGDSSVDPSAAMKDTILVETNLTEALLIDVRLDRADLTRAKLSRANLYGSTLTDARLATHLDDVMNLPRLADRSRSLPGVVPPSLSRCPGPRTGNRP
jgi:hypothetical protein